MPFHPAEIHAWKNRDWAQFDARDRARRAREDPTRKVEIAVELYEAARETRPDWPTPADRWEDCLRHLRLSALLRRAAHVRAQ